MDWKWEESLRSAVGAGIQIKEFWEMTPIEINIYIENSQDKQVEKINELIYLAWHISAFDRQKKLPSIQTLFHKKKKKNENKNKSSKEEMIEIAKRKGLEGPWEKGGDQ